MIEEYRALKRLMGDPAWQILENEWLAQVTKIEEARDKAAKRGGESAWRYWAGQEYGFKLCMTAITRAITRMEEENDSLSHEEEYESLLKEAKGEKA